LIRAGRGLSGFTPVSPQCNESRHDVFRNVGLQLNAQFGQKSSMRIFWCLRDARIRSPKVCGEEILISMTPTNRCDDIDYAPLKAWATESMPSHRFIKKTINYTNIDPIASILSGSIRAEQIEAERSFTDD
jgi:hypothetical protein